MKVLAMTSALGLAVAGESLALATERPRGVVAGCSMRAEADFPGAFKSSRNVVVGPVVLIGAAGTPGFSYSFHGNKFPLLVKAGHRLTVELSTRTRKGAGLVCYRLHAENVTLPTIAAHIHKGAAGVNGPVVVPFSAPGANGTSSGCTATTAAIIDDILANRAGYYVNVHTKEHPGGAIRAQLG